MTYVFVIAMNHTILSVYSNRDSARTELAEIGNTTFKDFDKRVINEDYTILKIHGESFDIIIEEQVLND